MARIRFTADHEHKPDWRTTHVYREGEERTVTQAVADEAVAAGRAELVTPEPRARRARPAKAKAAGETAE